jgi:DNA-binding NarL/FixJ family response regulator
MGKSPRIKVLIVDDHQVVREGLRKILEMDKQIQVIGEARNGEEAIVKTNALAPDVVIMDLKMPGMDGIVATHEIKNNKPDTNVLILTLYAEDFVKQAIEAGASGYILKDSDTEQITRAVHQVNEGLCPIAPSLTHDLVTRYVKLSLQENTSILNKRQAEILKMIFEGVSGNDIGNSLFISTSTVKREIRNIFDKLGVNDRAQAVSEAMKRRIL